MRKILIEALRRTAGMAAIAGIVAGTMASGIDRAAAADMPGAAMSQQVTKICGQNVDDIILFDEKGRPTIPARTPFFYCVTGETLLPGQIPPPPEYCCK
ncbi:MAG: hypothetical protein E2O93_00290 [Alphaproteobacteria bacterium]|nr:MAG: hypothetical protein E2O93_00290 [Alphaproteobacteria bacterium]